MKEKYFFLTKGKSSFQTVNLFFLEKKVKQVKKREKRKIKYPFISQSQTIIISCYIYFSLVGIYNELLSWKGDEPLMTSRYKSAGILHVASHQPFESARIRPQNRHYIISDSQ